MDWWRGRHMWAKKIVQALLRKDSKEALEYAEEKDADYEETKRRLSRVEARLNALGEEASVPQLRGDKGDGGSVRHGVTR